MKKKRKWSKEYSNYRARYYKERKIGNTKVGTRVLSYDQYRTARKEKHMTDKQIMDEHVILKSKGEKTKIMKVYNKIKKGYKRGEFVETPTMVTTGHGEVEEDIDVISYHYNLSGLLNDKEALHFIISYRINQGEDREKVVADYGY